ncbi:MAG: hypothetical protein HOV80_07645 [Polyangiaceae bacterium]|nr:hypothetical protein [Polyangiaceae bacterium]
MSRALAFSGLALAVMGASCALTFPDYEAEPEGSTSTGAGGSGGQGGSGAGGSDSPFVADACMPGTFATGVTPEGKLVCATIDGATVDAVNASCTIYAGWKDNCAGCDDPPTKWGSVSATSCVLGAGAGDTCQTPMLDGSAIQLFGLNTDGVVNNDDKFYYGMSCAPGSSTTAPGPCGPNEFLQGYDGVIATCVPASGAIMSFVTDQCSLYFGERDGCNASCTSAPERWGKVGSNSCDIGTGAPNTCTTTMLDGVEVQLLGVNTTGNPVDGDNKFYVALDCRPPAAESTSVPGMCPAGKLIVGIESDGTLHCASPAPAIATAFGARCTLYSGWKDQCQSGCLADGQTPSKWGRVRVGTCANQQGNDSTCQDSILGGVMVKTFGLNTDGFVSESDKFFTGFACQ